MNRKRAFHQKPTVNSTTSINSAPWSNVQDMKTHVHNEAAPKSSTRDRLSTNSIRVLSKPLNRLKRASWKNCTAMTTDLRQKKWWLLCTNTKWLSHFLKVTNPCSKCLTIRTISNGEKSLECVPRWSWVTRSSRREKKKSNNTSKSIASSFSIHLMASSCPMSAPSWSKETKRICLD